MLRAAAIVALLLLGASPVLAAETTLRASRPGQPPVTLRAEPGDGTWRVRVLDAKGDTVQSIEAGNPGAGELVLRDGDGDGAQDLWLPTITGNVNTEYELWRMDPAKGRFSQAGTLSGYQFRLDGAWLVAMGRDGCCAHEYLFHRFDRDGKLVVAFTITLRFGENDKVESCEASVQAGPPDEATSRLWCAARDGAVPGRQL